MKINNFLISFKIVDLKFLNIIILLTAITFAEKKDEWREQQKWIKTTLKTYKQVYSKEHKKPIWEFSKDYEIEYTVVQTPFGINKENCELKFKEPKTPLEYTYEKIRSFCYFKDWEREKYLSGPDLPQFYKQFPLTAEQYKGVYFSTFERFKRKRSNPKYTFQYVIYYNKVYSVITFLLKENKLFSVEYFYCKPYNGIFLRNYDLLFELGGNQGLRQMQWRNLEEEKKIFNNEPIPLSGFRKWIRNFPNN